MLAINTEFTSKLGMETDVYLIIHKYGPITKAEIVKQTGLKQTTVNRLFDRLIEKEMIQEYGYAESSVGRPPVLYVINPNYKYVIGVDISRTYTKVILSNLLFTDIENETFNMTEHHTPEKTLDLVIEIIKQFLNKRNITLEEVLCMGIGAVGPLDRKKGMILNPPLFINKEWKDIHIVEYLKSKLPVNIVLETGGNSAVIGEYYKSSLSYNNVLYCVSNRGVRCGLFSNGRIVHNKVGNTVAFGHIIVDVNGRQCECGNKGCLNTYISTPSIINDIQSEISKGTSSILSSKGEKLTIDDIIFGLENEDFLTKKVVSQSTLYYGIGLANMINLFNPELVILNGILFERSNYYFESVVNNTMQHVYPGNSNKVIFSKGALGNNAIAVGAAIRAFYSNVHAL